MNILLPRMEMEHKAEPIEYYASIFPLVLESIGFSCIRWSERLIPLFAEYVMYSYSTLATLKVSSRTQILLKYNMKNIYM